jgi:hypothetical protein
MQLMPQAVKITLNFSYINKANTASGAIGTLFAASDPVHLNKNRGSGGGHYKSVDNENVCLRIDSGNSAFRAALPQFALRRATPVALP